MKLKFYLYIILFIYLACFTFTWFPVRWHKLQDANGSTGRGEVEGTVTSMDITETKCSKAGHSILSNMCVLCGVTQNIRLKILSASEKTILATISHAWQVNILHYTVPLRPAKKHTW